MTEARTRKHGRRFCRDARIRIRMYVPTHLRREGGRERQSDQARARGREGWREARKRTRPAERRWTEGGEARDNPMGSSLLSTCGERRPCREERGDPSKGERREGWGEGRERRRRRGAGWGPAAAEGRGVAAPVCFCARLCVCARMRACVVPACACARVRMRVRACAHACVRLRGPVSVRDA